MLTGSLVAHPRRRMVYSRPRKSGLFCYLVTGRDTVMERSASRARAPGSVEQKVPGNADVTDLLRQILARTNGEGALDNQAAKPIGGPAEVLVVQLDGQVYTLIRRPPAPPPAPAPLSPREKEIVRLVAKGLPNKAIAGVLEISAWTVATHLRRIFAKLEVNSRAEMVAQALKAGLLAGGEGVPGLP